MTDTSTSDSDSDPDWYRLDDETTKAQLYPHEDHKEGGLDGKALPVAEEVLIPDHLNE